MGLLDTFRNWNNRRRAISEHGDHDQHVEPMGERSSIGDKVGRIAHNASLPIRNAVGGAARVFKDLKHKWDHRGVPNPMDVANGHAPRFKRDMDNLNRAYHNAREGLTVSPNDHSPRALWKRGRAAMSQAKIDRIDRQNVKDMRRNRAAQEEREREQERITQRSIDYND